MLEQMNILFALLVVPILGRDIKARFSSFVLSLLPCGVRYLSLRSHRNDVLPLALALLLSSSGALLFVLVPLGGLTFACLRGYNSAALLSNFSWHLLSPVSAACVLYTLAEDVPRPSQPLDTKDDPASWVGARSLVVSGRSVVDPPPTLEIFCTVLEPAESNSSLEKGKSGKTEVEKGAPKWALPDGTLDETALNKCAPTYLSPSRSSTPRDPSVSLVHLVSLEAPG